MDLALTESQEMLKGTAAEFVKTEAPAHLVTELSRKNVGYVADLWQKAAALGWAGVLTPTAYGGAGMGYTDAAVIFEELGRAPLAGPFFSSGILAPLVIQEAGTEEQKRDLLPALARGERIAAVAISDPAPMFGPESVLLQAQTRNGDYVLNGTKLFVLDAAAADILLCAVRTAPEDPAEATRGISLVAVDRRAPGVAVRPLEGFMSAMGQVDLKDVRVPATAVLGAVGGGWGALTRAMSRALPVLCAYQVGGCQEVYEFTAEYTRTRVVFGQPIGRFQRVQDHVVELLNHLDGARWTTYEALWRLDDGLPAASSVHLAKAVSSQGYYQACVNSLEVHAGVGTDRQHPLVPHVIMARTLYGYLGDPRYHKRLMADAAGI